MPASVGTIEPDGRPGRPSARKPANAAAQASSRLKTASKPGCNTGANGRFNRGATSQKLSESPSTSFHVALSSCVASGPGRMPLEKKTMLTYVSHVSAGTIRTGSAMILEAAPRRNSDAEPGLSTAGSGTSKPYTRRPSAPVL
eukprot:scaffold187460_cov35-Tisochrysis_lutea.AAC.2